MNQTIIKTVTDPIETKIFICGDLDVATQECLDYCTEVGLCVTVTPTMYVYRGGRQSGMIIGLINYPRFPSNRQGIWAHAMNLAVRLKYILKQGSFTVQNDKVSTFVSDRDEDQPK